MAKKVSWITVMDAILGVLMLVALVFGIGCIYYGIWTDGRWVWTGGVTLAVDLASFIVYGLTTED